MRLPPRFSVAACVVAIGLGPMWTSVARADATEDAKVAFDDGQAAFAAKRYSEAAAAFERSARAKAHPASLVNAAEAWELDGNLVRAARACDWALTLEMDAATAKPIRERLARLVPSIGTIVVVGDPRVIAKLDGDPVRPGDRIRVSRGRHALVVTRTRGDEMTELDLAAGEERRIELAPEVTSSPPEPRKSGSLAPPIATWASLGVAAVAGGVAIGFGVATASAKTDYEANPTVEGRDAFYRDRTITNVALAVTGVAVLAGIAFWIFWPKRDARAAFTPLAVRF
jgi:hypothetical protein